MGVLPKCGDTEDFFNMEFFRKMKTSSVFMNIGRGPTVNESELVSALKEGVIAGAVLDVYKVEPLPQTSELWSLPNVLMTPHCADQDPEYLVRALKIFNDNLERFKQNESLLNVCDKKLGY